MPSFSARSSGRSKSTRAPCLLPVTWPTAAYDLAKLGALLDKYPNLYADISARFAETASIPRAAKKFYQKYQDRLVYGTDMGPAKPMYLTTFRILETEDEHFYDWDLFSYHWPLNGFGLSDSILEEGLLGERAEDTRTPNLDQTLIPVPPRLLAPLLSTALLALAAAAVAAPAPLTLYVATNGNDLWSGHLAAPNKARTDGPLSSLAGARDRLRGERTGNQPVQVLVRGGTYSLPAPFVLEPQDSGTAEAPVVYAAFQKEKPVFSGGRVVTGFRQAGNSVGGDHPRGEGGPVVLPPVIRQWAAASAGACAKLRLLPHRRG